MKTRTFLGACDASLLLAAGPAIVIAPNDGGMEQFGHCDALDANQDLFVLSFHDDMWRIEGGTGRFPGMTGGGTTRNIHTWPDGSYLISWTGTTSK